MSYLPNNPLITAVCLCLTILFFQVLLPKPTLCPVEIYDLMCECWKRDEGLRPTFKEIYMFLKRKNMGYRPGD